MAPSVGNLRVVSDQGGDVVAVTLRSPRIMGSMGKVEEKEIVNPDKFYCAGEIFFMERRLIYTDREKAKADHKPLRDAWIEDRNKMREMKKRVEADLR